MRAAGRQTFAACLDLLPNFLVCGVTGQAAIPGTPLAGRFGAVYALIRPEEDEAVEGERASTRRGDCE